MAGDGTVNLTATAGGTLTWTNGSGNKLWDVASKLIPAQGSPNWDNGGVADKFYDGDDVTIASAGGAINIALADNVYPTHATMDLATGTLSMGAKNLGAYIFNVSNSTIDTGTGNLTSGTLSLTNSTLAANAGNPTVDNFALINSNVTGTGSLNVRVSADLQSGTINTNLTGTSGFIKTTAGTVTLKGTDNPKPVETN